MKKIILIGAFVVALQYGCQQQKLQSNVIECEKQPEVLETNKKIVTEFYQELFGDKNVEAINKYIGDVYIQHNPYVADGKQALKEATKKWFVHARKETIDIQHIAADGDLVIIHLKNHDQPRTVSVIDIFRLKNGKIIEHWDVAQEVPEKAANNHPMF